MRQVKTLGLLGTGVIGGGWAARALHFGFDVVAADANPRMQEWLTGAIENAQAALSRLTLAPLPAPGRLTFTTEPDQMARAVDFVQENIPEQLDLKQRVDDAYRRSGHALFTLESHVSHVAEARAVEGLRASAAESPLPAQAGRRIGLH